MRRRFLIVCVAVAVFGGVIAWYLLQAWMHPEPARVSVHVELQPDCSPIEVHSCPAPPGAQKHSFNGDYFYVVPLN